MSYSTIRCMQYLMLAVLLAIPLVGFGQPREKAGAKEEKKGKADNVKEYAVLETSMGTFEVELYPQDAPKTVENFVKLAEKKFFDGMRFHRVSKGFVIQIGDDKSKDTAKVAQWGKGGKSIWGKEFEDELNPNAPSYKEGYKKGVMAMANRGRNTNTSQFFIMLVDKVTMPKNYTIFGKVIKGQEVVDKIGDVEIIPVMSQNDGRPKVDVILKKITVKPAG
jgi:cyclophilin family peptidyl-prolyl cis-trans isomerase